MLAADWVFCTSVMATLAPLRVTLPVLAALLVVLGLAPSGALPAAVISEPSTLRALPAWMVMLPPIEPMLVPVLVVLVLLPVVAVLLLL